MTKLPIIVMWLLVILCGGCAVDEVLTGKGNVVGLLLVMTSLAVIIYIIRLPEDMRSS